MNEEEIRKNFLNLEIFETWKNYERISFDYKIENPLTYEDVRNSFKCYYYGGFYIPEEMIKAKIGNIFLRFIPEDIFKEYSKSIGAPVFGFERQLRKRIIITALNALPKKDGKIDVEIFNKIWNLTFNREEFREIIEIRKTATKGLILLSKISSFFNKYYIFLQKVREWEYEQFKKGKVY
jgi:hypothetical protein